MHTCLTVCVRHTVSCCLHLKWRRLHEDAIRDEIAHADAARRALRLKWQVFHMKRIQLCLWRWALDVKVCKQSCFNVCCLECRNSPAIQAWSAEYELMALEEQYGIILRVQQAAADQDRKR